MRNLSIDLYKILTLFMVIFGFSFAKAQEFNVKYLNKDTVEKYLDISSFKTEYAKYKTIAFDVHRNLASSLRKENQDLTASIQYALNNNKIVLLPNYSIKINDRGLILNNDQVLLFQPKTILKLIPTAKNSYSILRLTNVSNVKVFNANIEGDKYTHLAKDGQWGFGIGIKSSNNIFIYSPYIKQTWGDGIYIGQTQGIPSTNICIYNAVIDDARRNGISITSANGVKIKNSYIANTSGQSPKSGIDLEPNDNTDVLENIEIINTTSFNNEWAGLLIVLDGMEGVNNKKVSVKIKNFKDFDSKYSFAARGLIKNKYKNFKLGGQIIFDDSSSPNKKYYFYKSNFSLLELKEVSLDFRKEMQYRNTKGQL